MKNKIFLASITLVLFGTLLGVHQTQKPGLANTSAKAAANQDKYTMTQRFGLGFNNNSCAEGCSDRSITEFDYQKTGGFYLDWGWGIREPLGGFKRDLEFMTLIGGWGQRAPESPTDPLCRRVKKATTDFPDKYRDNMLWIIGNEIGWDDGGKTPEVYAQELVKWKDCLTSINPTFKVGSGAIIQFNIKIAGNTPNISCVDYDDPQSGKSYFTGYITEIRNKFGEDSLPDFIVNHGYTPCSLTNQLLTENWANVDLFKESMRVQRETMKNLGIETKDLIIKEFSPLPKDATNDLIGYMDKTVSFMATATDPVIGNPEDGDRLVQRWVWFVFNDWNGRDEWPHLELFNTYTTEIKPLGEKYRELLVRFKEPDSLMADVNNDCIVNTLDFNILAREFGRASVGLKSDFDGDFKVTSTDSDILATSLFSTCP